MIMPILLKRKRWWEWEIERIFADLTDENVWIK